MNGDGLRPGPSAAFGVRTGRPALDLIGHDGPKRELGWIDRIAGLGVLALGIWLVQFR